MELATILIQLAIALIPTVTAFLAYLQARATKARVEAVHVDVNSRLTELIKQTGLAQHAAGKAEGLAERDAAKQ